MPRTLAQNAQYIAETIKPAIKSAIEAQGVTVPSTDSFLDYADRIGEIEGGGSGYQLKDLPTGAISTVNDAAELPLNALKVSVEAWQEGSGDPSPSNIRPIHGWDSASIYNRSKNLFPMTIDEIKSANTQGTWSGNDYSYGGMIFTLILDAKNSILGIKINGRAEGSYKDFFFTGTTRVNLATYGLVYGNQYTISGSKSGLTVMLNGGNANITASESGTTFIATNSDVYFPALRPTSYASFDNVIIYPQIEAGTQTTDFVPYCTTYTHAFTDAQGNPLTVYGTEWDVVGGELKQTDGYIASYNGETLPSTWISDRDVYASGTTPTIGAEVVYKLATPTTIQLSPLSIRLLEGTNNIYADCGDIIDGEYFVDEGAIDVRKVDYQIGSSGSIKTTDGRVFSGFASMSGYHARPLDTSGNWLDVDWSKDFEVCVAFKYTDSGASGITVLLGYNYDSALNSRFKSPLIYIDKDHSRDLCLEIGSNGSSWMVDQSLSYAIDLDTWYALKLKFTLSTLTLECSISTDFDTWTSLYNNTLSAAPYHSNTSMIGIGSGCQASAWSSNGLLVDTFNTYIKGDGVNWGASTGAFPS